MFALAAAIATATGNTEAMPTGPEAKVEILTVGHTNGGPAPGLKDLTFYADGDVRYRDSGQEPSCKKLSPGDLAALRQALETNEELLEALSVVDYTARMHDVETIGFQFPKGSRPTHGGDIEVPVELLPQRLLPLVRTIDDLGRRACGPRYEPLLPPAR